VIASKPFAFWIIYPHPKSLTVPVKGLPQLSETPARAPSRLVKPGTATLASGAGALKAREPRESVMAMNLMNCMVLAEI
jgi:hypothetical protein